MGVIMNPVSNRISRILSGRACSFTPYPNRHPQFLANAVVVKSRSGARGIAPLTAVFVWGLRRTRTTKTRISPEAVRRLVKSAFPQGGAVVLQLGWWDGMNEDAARVTIENSGPMSLSDSAFKVKVDALIRRIITEYAQEEVWIDYYRGTKRVASRSYRWE
jgi:hypothetical protein